MLTKKEFEQLTAAINGMKKYADHTRFGKTLFRTDPFIYVDSILQLLKTFTEDDKK